MFATSLRARRVQEVLRRVEAVTHQHMDGLPTPFDGLVDQGPVVRMHLREHVVGALLFRGRLPDADTQAQEIARAQGRFDRSEAVVPGGAAAVLEPDASGWAVELVLDDDGLLPLSPLLLHEASD